MSGYAFGAGVAADLGGIWEYIAADDLNAADRLIDTFYTQFEYLAAFPRMGHARPAIRGGRFLMLAAAGQGGIAVEATGAARRRGPMAVPLLRAA